MSEINKINIREEKKINLEPAKTKNEKVEEDFLLFDEGNEYSIENNFEPIFQYSSENEASGDSLTINNRNENEELPDFNKAEEKEYDENGRISVRRFFDTEGNLENLATIKYDDRGNITEFVMYSGNQTIGSREKSEYYDDNTLKYNYVEHYNTSGKLTYIEEYRYDEKGRMTEESYYDSDGEITTKSEYEYYENGNTKTYRDYQYNSTNNTIDESNYTEDGRLESNHFYKINIDGQVLDNSLVEFDENENPIKTTKYDSSGNVQYIIENEYDEYGNITLERISDGTGAVIRTIEKQYDEYGNRIGSVIYDSLGEISERSEIKYNESGNFQREVTYDKEGNIISETNYYYDESGGYESAYTTQYDKDGNIIFELQYEFSEYYDFEEVYIPGTDEEIGYTQQGLVGDCWLLSGLTALSYTEEGSNIIRDALSQNEDGSYSVYLKGIDTSITITEEEMQDARALRMFSSGDNDVLLIELAFEAALKQIKNGDIQIEGEHEKLSVEDYVLPFMNVLEGGFFEDALFLLTGNDATIIHDDAPDKSEQFDEIFDKLENNPGSVAVTFGFLASDCDEEVIIKDINGNYVFTVSQYSGHAFSIKSVEGDNVIIVNPNDSSCEYVVSRDTLKQYANDIEYYDFNS